MNMGFMTSGDERSMEDSQHPWMVSRSKKKKKKQRRTKGIIATRESSRVPKDGRTMLEKAVQRAEAKDVTTKGNVSTNQFLILNELDNDYIHNVASELDLEIENIDTQIETFKAEERVRAALAEANYKEYLDRINKKNAPRGEEELQEFSLSIIDNSTREVGLENSSPHNESSVPPRGRGRPKNKKK